MSLSMRFGYSVFLDGFHEKLPREGDVGHYRIRLEISGRILLWTLICDIGNPDDDRRSIKDMSNLYSLLPLGLSMERPVRYVKT